RLVPAPVPAASGGIERLVVRKLNREFILNTAEIDRIESDGNYVTIHSRGASYPLRESLASLEKRLDPKRFARVHRGHIVNLDCIREIQPWDSGDYRILLKDGSCVNFSRRYRGRLSQLFNS
ncbi:MAG: LytTR family DNA-binding domain-containing protein, partial [Gammaproteobacteria bacterium]